MFHRANLRIYLPFRTKYVKTDKDTLKKVPGRFEIYARNLPQTSIRLYMAKKIAKRVGLIKKGLLEATLTPLGTYYDNLMRVRLIEHCLYRLEIEEQVIKVTKENVYYKAPTMKKVDVFRVISNTIAEIIASDRELKEKLTFRERQDLIDPVKIREKCKNLFEPFTGIFIREKPILDEDEIELKKMDVEKLKKWSFFRALSGIRKTKGDKVSLGAYLKTIIPTVHIQAKETVAGRYFYKKNKEVFERDAYAKEFLRKPGDKENPAKIFQKRLNFAIASAKRFALRHLEYLFEFGPANGSPLFGKDKLRAILNLFYFVGIIDKSQVKTLDECIADENIPEELRILPKRTRLLFIKNGIKLNTKKEIIHKDDSYSVSTLKQLKNLLILTEVERQARDNYEFTFVISDLHLQSFRHRDIFELLRLFILIKKLKGTLIINGDFIDSWRIKYLQFILRANSLLFNAMRIFDRVIVVAGNHDRWLNLMKNQKILNENVSIVSSYYDPISRIYAEHGHRFQKANREGSEIGKYVTRIVRELEKTFGQKITNWLELIGMWLLSLEYLFKRLYSRDTWQDAMGGRVFNAVKTIFKERNNVNDPFTEEKPLVINLAHFHFPGVGIAYKRVLEMIEQDKELRGRVIFLLNGSFQNNEGAAGMVTVFAKRRDNPEGQLFISPFLWDYIGGKAIRTLYGEEVDTDEPRWLISDEETPV